MKKAEELFTNVANEDGARDRSGLLALLELEKRARHCGVSSGAWLASLRCLTTDKHQDPGRLLHLMQQYFEKVGDKACCFEDLKPYQILEGEDSIKWTSYLDSVPDTFVR